MMKNKKLKILTVIALCLLALVLVYFIVARVMPVRLRWVDENGEKVSAWLDKEDSDTVRDIIGRAERRNDSDTCGYDNEHSFYIGLVGYRPATDGCNGMQALLGYYDITEEDAVTLQEIAVKYGGFVI